MTERVYASYTAQDIDEMRESNGIMIKRIVHLTEENIKLNKRISLLEEDLKYSGASKEVELEVAVDNEKKVA